MADQQYLISEIARMRRDFYQAIVDRDASQGKFLKGWMRRIDSVEEYCLNSL
jgi:hypothetical protein